MTRLAEQSAAVVSSLTELFTHLNGLCGHYAQVVLIPSLLFGRLGVWLFKRNVSNMIYTMLLTLCKCLVESRLKPSQQ